MMLVFGYFCLFNATATTDIYPFCHTLSRHDALPISCLSPQASPCLKVDGNLLTAVPVGIVRNESRDLGNLLRVDASHRAESPKITFLAEVPGDGHSMVIVE